MGLPNDQKIVVNFVWLTTLIPSSNVFGISSLNLTKRFLRWTNNFYQKCGFYQKMWLISSIQII